MSPSPSRKCGAVTLIELLAVIMIIGIAASIAIPALQRYDKAVALSTTGNKVANVIAKARQSAMARNTLTALVLLTGTGTAADYAAVGVFEFSDGRWLALDSWEMLPTGVVFDTDRESATFLEKSPALPLASPEADTSPIWYDNKGVPKTGYACRVFLPSGGLSNPEDAAVLRLVEGTIEGPDDERTARYARTVEKDDKPGPANYYDLAIVGTTGSVKIDRP